MFQVIPAIAILVVGLLIGYLGQRSRFCIVSGIRDCYLVRNFHRIGGLLGLIIGAGIGFALFKIIGGNIINYPSTVETWPKGYIIATVVGSAGMGFFSVLAEGCPFRQHVMAAQGRESAVFYLMGFYVGIAYFFVVVINYFEAFIKITG